VRRYLSTISLAHRVAKLVNPCIEEAVRLEVKCLYNAMSARQRQAKALGWAQADYLVAVTATSGCCTCSVIEHRSRA
jgi:hypothetical protein